MQAYKFVAAYSGVLNDAGVEATYGGDKYKALDAVIATTRTKFDEQRDNIKAGVEMAISNKSNDKVLDLFRGDRWEFMVDLLLGLQKKHGNKKL